MRSQQCTCNDLTEVQIAQGDHYDDCPVQIANDAATRMRGRCVDRVKELRNEWLVREKNHLDAHGDCASSKALREHYSAANQVITALESLTLDGEKEQ